MTFAISPLTRAHDRSKFDSSVAELDTFLKMFARQNDDKGLSRTFVATAADSNVIVGYHSVRSGAIAFDVLPEEEQKKLPRYPIPVMHIGRLAVDVGMRGRRLGESLLMHALGLATRVAVNTGLYAVEVIAKDEKARTFYAHYGFQSLLDDSLHLYLSMKTVRALGL